MDIINLLRSAYFFDISASSGQKISFVKRGSQDIVQVNGDNLIKLTEASYINEVKIAYEQILSKVDIFFQNQLNNYDDSYLHINNENFSNLKNVSLNLPLVISVSEAARIGHLLLKNAAAENKVLEFNLPISHLSFEATDYIDLNYKDNKYHLRVVKITFSGLTMNIIAIIDDVNNYHTSTLASSNLSLIYQNIEFDYQIIELPFKIYDYDFPYITAFLNNNISLPLYARVKNDISSEWTKISLLEPNNMIAKIIKINSFDKPNFFLKDELSSLEILIFNLDHLNNKEWKLALINNEIIAFKHVQKLENNSYKISGFIRGLFATEQFAKDHKIGSKIIILKQPNVINLSKELKNQELEFKINDLKQGFTYTAKSSKRCKPIIILNYIENNKLYLRWMRRNFTSDGWSKANKKLEKYTVKITSNDQIHDIETDLGANNIEIDITNMNISDQYIVDIV